jgi:hypothetical protein
MLHRVTVKVRSKFPQVDALVIKMKTKKIFFKAPAREMQLKYIGAWCYTAPEAQCGKSELMLPFTIAITFR